MTFNRNGVLYKIVYGWPTNPKRRWDEESRNTNICAFFWRTVLSFLIVWPFIIITLAGGWVIRIIGAPFAFVLFGYKPADSSWRISRKKTPNSLIPFVPIKWWPKWRGNYVMPIMVLLVPVIIIMFVLLGLWIVFYRFLWEVVIQWFFVGVVFGTTTGTAIFWPLFIAAIVAVVYMIVRNTEAWQMCKGFAQSKKEKLCWVVTFK